MCSTHRQNASGNFEEAGGVWGNFCLKIAVFLAILLVISEKLGKLKPYL
jgi:hypothetical protein